MRFILLAAGCSAWLAGCAASWAPAGDSPSWPAPGATARYDFGWRLSGNRRVAPVQVFDDGHDTWLQFRSGQALPAIFVGGPGGERLVAYERRDPYVRVRGVWPSLVLRGGGLEARADSLRMPSPAVAVAGPVAQPDGAAPAAVAPGAESPKPLPGIAAGKEPGVTATAAASGASASGAPVASAAPGASAAFGTSKAPGISGTSRASQAAASVPQTPTHGAAAPAAPAAAQPAALRFAVGPDDQNMRRALSRWARQAGWTFEAEHWALDVDIPVSGSATFEADFRKAVRELLASTELADRPAQPCFYSNRVLRVIPLAQHCNRTVARGEPS